jgi:catechol 2,3-dioxygenase-like lactoylglutathione lyase family enzyme
MSSHHGRRNMLGKKDAIATIAVKDLDAASTFYGGRLGLQQVSRIPGAITYKSGHSSVLVYESQFAGTNKATAVTWAVEDVEGVVDSLRRAGTRFEHYDLPGMSREGDVHRGGDVTAAWFKDPDGNIIALVNDVAGPREKQERRERALADR